MADWMTSFLYKLVFFVFHFHDCKGTEVPWISIWPFSLERKMTLLVHHENTSAYKTVAWRQPVFKSPGACV